MDEKLHLHEITADTKLIRDAADAFDSIVQTALESVYLLDADHYDEAYAKLTRLICNQP